MRSFLSLAEEIVENSEVIENAEEIIEKVEEVASANIPEVPEGFFGTLMYGLNVSLIGIITVFAVLALIMGVLYLFRLYFYDLPNKKKAEESQPKAAPAPVAKTAAPVAAVASEEDELVPVVIAAAVAAYMETNAPKSKYRIRSFKRI